MTKRFVAPAVAAAVLLALPASSLAAAAQKLDVKVSPTKAGTTKKPKISSLSVTTGTSDDSGAQPPTLSRATIYFPAGMTYNGALFPTCSASSISQAKTTTECPANSIIGKGKAAGVAPGPVTQNDLTVTAVNGGRNAVNLFVDGSSPLRIQSNLAGRLSRAGGGFGLKLVVDIPENLQQPTEGVNVAITLFQVRLQKTLKVKGKSRGIIESTGCAGGAWKSKGEFQYANGAPGITTQASQKCSR